MGKGGGSSPAPAQVSQSPNQVIYPSRASTLTDGQNAIDNQLSAYIGHNMQSQEGTYGKDAQQLYPLNFDPTQFPSFNQQSYQNMLQQYQGANQANQMPNINLHTQGSAYGQPAGSNAINIASNASGSTNSKGG